MAAKICTIEIMTQGYSCFIAVPDWLSPKDSRVVSERHEGYFFSSKRDAKLFARLLKRQVKNCHYNFIIDIDDLPF